MIQPRRVKVTNGKITHAEYPGGGIATSPPRSAVGVDAPDGTYLHLDFVVALLREAEARMQSDDDLIGRTQADLVVQEFIQTFEQMAL